MCFVSKKVTKNVGAMAVCGLWTRRGRGGGRADHIYSKKKKKVRGGYVIDAGGAAR